VSLKLARADSNWRHEAMLLAQALAEAILIAPWPLILLNGARHFSPDQMVTLCLLIILGTLYLARTMQVLDIHELIQRAMILIELLALIVIAANSMVFNSPQWAWLREPGRYLNDLLHFLPEEIIVVLAMTLLVWRGLALAAKPRSDVEATREFQIGVIVLALFVVVSAQRDIMLYIPAYFFCQLLAIGLARVESISNERGGRRTPFSGWWLAVLAGSTLLVVAIAGEVSGIVLGIGPEQLINRMWPILRIILLPVMIILLPFLMLLGIIVEAIASPLAKSLENLSINLSQFSSAPDQTQTKPAIDMEPLIRAVRYGSTFLVVAIVVAVMLAVVWIAGRRRRARVGKEMEQHESVWSGQALVNKLVQQIQNRLAQLKKFANIAERFGAGGLFTALTIRRVYAQTVKLAASRGYPRPAAHTPYEHLAALRQAFPGCDADLIQITEAYVGVHYGELPERSDALNDIRAAFERINSTAQQANRETP